MLQNSPNFPSLNYELLKHQPRAVKRFTGMLVTCKTKSESSSLPNDMQYVDRKIHFTVPEQYTTVVSHI